MTRLPILFIHGIGIGLYPYIKFLADLNAEDAKDSSNGQVGIIAIEMMPISSRITAQAMLKDDMCEELDCILKAHGWERFVLVSHSWVSPLAFSLFVCRPLSYINFEYVKLRKRGCHTSPPHPTDRTEDWADFVCGSGVFLATSP